jgi:type I restriction enzyme S subunit
MNEALPRGWIEINLDKTVIYGKGKKPKKLAQKNDVGLVPYVNIKAFEKGIIDEFADVKSSKLINKTDILVVWDGARFGLTGMGMEGAAGSTLMVLTPVLNKPEYIYNFIIRHYSYINSKPKGTGTPHVNPDIFWKLQLPIAPLNEQKRIVAKLDKIMPRIDAVKERLDKVPAIVKRFRQSVLTAAVTGKLTEKWRTEHPDVESAEDLLCRIKRFRIENVKSQRELTAIEKNYEEGEERLKKKESPFELPESWCFCEINNIGNVNNGSTPPRKISQYWNGSINWISSGEVANSIIRKTRETITEKGFKNSSVKLLPVGTVLIAMIGEGKTRGQTAILEIESTCNQNVAAVVINHGLVLSKYLYLWFFMQYERNRSYGSGSGPKALNCQRVRELDFNLPPLEEQKEIVRQVDKLFAFADKLELHYQKAKARVDKLSQSVLAKAFRGELVITEAELAEKEGRDFESAKKFLERILEEKAKLVESRKLVGGKKKNEKN